jgi:hypothetical protein
MPKVEGTDGHGEWGWECVNTKYQHGDSRERMMI